MKKKNTKFILNKINNQILLLYINYELRFSLGSKPDSQLPDIKVKNIFC